MIPMVEGNGTNSVCEGDAAMLLLHVDVVTSR
jgi:hypothetical protein